MISDWTDYRAKAHPFDLTGRFTPEFERFFNSLADRFRSEKILTKADIEDLGRNEFIFDTAFLTELNREMRSFKTRWLASDAEETYWPDDYLIIGGSGSGDYYCISSSERFRGIQIYEHEIGAFEDFAPDFDAFYETIMTDIRKRHIQ
jgi:hypothetical protein